MTEFRFSTDRGNSCASGVAKALETGNSLDLRTWQLVMTATFMCQIETIIGFRFSTHRENSCVSGGDLAVETESSGGLRASP